jgi:hypothetical protein
MIELCIWQSSSGVSCKTLCIFIKDLRILGKRHKVRKKGYVHIFVVRGVNPMQLGGLLEKEQRKTNLKFGAVKCLWLERYGGLKICGPKA